MKKTSRVVRTRVFLALAAVIGASSAQAATTLRLQEDSLGQIPVSALAQRLGLESDSALEEVRSAPTTHGTQTVRMRQTWRGIPVFDRGITVDIDPAGNGLAMSGDLDKDIAMDLSSATPVLSAEQARTIWRTQSGANLANAEIEEREADLYVYPQADGKARLIYLVSHFVGGEQPSRPTAFIDANTGLVVEQWEGLTTAEASGPGGNVKTGRYTYGTDRPALPVTQSGTYCTFQTPNVRTYNMANRTSGGGTLWRFLCPESQGDAVNGAYGPINDAHYFGGVVFDMYRKYLDAAPLRQALILRVHYGVRYENAFWQGGAMTFGDGFQVFHPLVALDVVAHEVSHGFTEKNSNLRYVRQSGGMNEAFSDIAGEAAKWFSREKNDFLVGAEIMKGNRAMRYMCDPPKDGRSIGHARNYNDRLDVHNTSGVYNKAFCLLAKTGDWNPEKAFKVFARANMLYWKADETFNRGACGVQRAATDLGYPGADVVGAFGQVGVTCL